MGVWRVASKKYNFFEAKPSPLQIFFKPYFEAFFRMVGFCFEKAVFFEATPSTPPQGFHLKNCRTSFSKQLPPPSPYLWRCGFAMRVGGGLLQNTLCV